MRLCYGGKGQDVIGGIFKQLGRVAEALGQLVNHTPVLRTDLLRVGLGKDRAVERSHEVLRRFRDLGQQIARKMRSTTLPARPQ